MRIYMNSIKPDLILPSAATWLLLVGRDIHAMDFSVPRELLRNVLGLDFKGEIPDIKFLVLDAHTFDRYLENYLIYKY